MAAEQGHANAQFDLGKLYLHGFDVPEDYAEAYVWFSVAAAGGHPDAAGLRDLAYSQLKAVQITLGQKRVAELLKKFGSGKQPEPPVTVDNSAPNKTNGPTSVELPESTNSIGMEFKLIPAGTFIMGDASGEEVLCSDLLTMAKAAKLAGVSRQAVGYWADGLGKGRGKRLKNGGHRDRSTHHGRVAERDYENGPRGQSTGDREPAGASVQDESSTGQTDCRGVVNLLSAAFFLPCDR